MKTSDVVWEIVKAYGIDTVFMLPGGGASHLVDSLGKSGLNYVVNLHEQGAGYAALGYGMYHIHKPGICLVTSGPGVTNAITPCAAAWTDSIPVIFISGQVSKNTMIGDTGLRSRGGQEVSVIPLVFSITKKVVSAISGEDVLDCLPEMLIHSHLGRPGPMWLDIPLDVQAEDIKWLF